VKIFDSLYERIMSKVQMLDWQNENGCWIFGGKLDKDGYGRLNARVDGKHTTIRAHKVVWETFFGPLPPELTLDHLDCIGKACCNPDHLEAVTRAENSRRAQERRRARA
jgi:hypothetical protein